MLFINNYWFFYCSYEPSVKRALLVVLRVAVGDEVEEQIQVFKAQFRLILRDLLSRVRGVVAELADEMHALLKRLVHDAAKLRRAHQRDQFVVPRRSELGVHGIHPLHGALHRAAAVQHARRRVDLINALRCRRALGERGKPGLF